MFITSSCWRVDGEGWCGTCTDCAGDCSDEMLFTLVAGGDEYDVWTQFGPVEFSDAEARTYTALRSEGLSIADAQAMTEAVLS